jgi:hypothetical protein
VRVTIYGTCTYIVWNKKKFWMRQNYDVRKDNEALRKYFTSFSDQLRQKMCNSSAKPESKFNSQTLLYLNFQDVFSFFFSICLPQIILINFLFLWDLRLRGSVNKVFWIFLFIYFKNNVKMSCCHHDVICKKIFLINYFNF